VKDLLQDPDLITRKYERRLAENGTPDATEEERHRIDAETRKLKKQEDRLLDAYQAGMMEMDVVKERMGTIRAQKKALEDRCQALENQERHARQKFVGSNVALAYPVAVTKTVRVESLEIDLSQRLG